MSSSATGARLRELLPAPNAPVHTRPDFAHPERESTGSNQDRPRSVVLPRLRSNITTVACEGCRKRKTRCSGERPACRTCISSGATCEYDAGPTETHNKALKRKHDAIQEANSVYEEFYHILRSRPAEDVTNILRRLRAGASIKTLMEQIKWGDLLLQLSMTPQTRFRYSMGSILDITDILETAQNPYLASCICKMKSSSADPPAQSATSPSLGISHPGAMYDAPYHTGQLVNVDIDIAMPSKWTSVSADDRLLREILRSYFTTSYTFFPFFHKDYFLRDLVSVRHRFCSSLLLNCILAAGCRGYNKLPKRSEFWDPASLYYKFIAEARRLWELESDEPSITRIQAAMALHLEYGLNGLDNIGWSFCLQAVVTAEEIRLFSTYLKQGKAWKAVQAITAWALFTWQALQRYHHEIPPLVIAPPELALPEEPDSYGETWVKYPAANDPVPLRFCQIFRALAEFRTIMNDIGNSTFSTSQLKEPIRLAQAMAYRSRLQQWYERLPDQLSPQNMIIPVHFHIHIHYWLVLVRLFEPLQVLEADEHGEFPASAPTPEEENPREIVVHAKTCLQTLVRLYYSCHGNDGYNFFMILDASFIGFAILNDMSVSDDKTTAIQEAHDSSVVLCAHILYGQGHMAYLGDAVFRVMQKNLPGRIAQTLAQFVNIRDVDQEQTRLTTQTIYSVWP